MGKRSVYIETSVWGMFVNSEPAVYLEAVERFFRECDEFELYVSPIVLEEIDKAHAETKEILLREISGFNTRVLPKNNEVTSLTKEYIQKGIFSDKQKLDAGHVAYASYNGINILLSFNFRHIVNYHRKNLVKSVNIVMGYATPEIVSPLEMFK